MDRPVPVILLSMWPFHKRDDLRTLARRIDDVESQVRRLETEWLDTYEKLKRLMGRLTKRDERLEPAEEPRRVTIAQLRANGRDPFSRR